MKNTDFTPDAAPRVVDEMGRIRTLAQGRNAFVRLDGMSPDARRGRLVLGLGPEAAAADRWTRLPEAAASEQNDDDVLWLECPAFAAAMDAVRPGWRDGLPTGWRETTPEDAAREARRREVWLYRQAERLFPTFWGPLLGQVRAELLGFGHFSNHDSSILLPGGPADLLHQELTEAFGAAGFAVRVPGDTASLARLLRQGRPALYFSVNGRGLDAEGADFTLLRACGVPVALWFVDNPWHILARLRQPWWREATLFVTDASFMSDLRAQGARHVHHLPLAFSPSMVRHAESAAASPAIGQPAVDGPVVFVGRASFPAREGFFAAARLDSADREAARALLKADGRPDFHWWTERLQASLWPGHAVRAAGLGAEECTVQRRARWLRAALSCGLTIYGDPQDWAARLPEAPPATFRDAVDYYTTLPGIYAAAPFSLNVTSLLLPAGLTQRHFDVWAAGGFLVTDATPGLDIFPAELTEEVRIPRAAALPATVERLERDSSLRRHLSAAWRTYILAAHGYAQRVNTVLNALDAKEQ